MHVRRNRCACSAVLVALLLSCGAGPANADEPAILQRIKQFFATDDVPERKALVAAILEDPAYDRAKVGQWLHQADLWDARPAGRHSIRAEIDDGSRLPITIRVPAGYEPRKPYPLIYALHGTGADAESILQYVEQILGPRCEEFLVAAPSGYQQVVINSAVRPSVEHPAALREIRRSVHVDSARVYALGYSRGGHAAMTLAVLHPDQFAGVVPIAGTLILAVREPLLESFLPNIANTRVLLCWGADDTLGPDLKTESPDGGIAAINRWMRDLAAHRRLPLTGVEDPGKGHAGIVPPAAELSELLAATRPAYPPNVDQMFRLLYQGSAYWIEAHEWVGDWWDERPVAIDLPPGVETVTPEEQNKLLAEAIRAKLGGLKGQFERNRIRVSRKRIRDLTTWFGDGMIDWSQPVELKLNGRLIYDKRLEPDLGVCLAQAARTLDFDRLRWAGVRYDGTRPRLVTLETTFPPQSALQDRP